VTPPTFRDITNDPVALAKNKRRAVKAKEPGWWGEFEGEVFQADNGLSRWAVISKLPVHPEGFDRISFYRTKDDAVHGWGKVHRENFACWNPSATFHLVRLTKDRPVKS